jgi:integrase
MPCSVSTAEHLPGAFLRILEELDHFFRAVQLLGILLFSLYSKCYINILTQQKEALVARHKKFHAICHTHATDLLTGGENIMEVTRRLGHSKASTTLDLYGHAIPGNDAKVAQKVAKLYKFEIEKALRYKADYERRSSK